jgi:alkylation response protein AidB-like acyl-CoA dehydrogenase
MAVQAFRFDPVHLPPAAETLRHEVRDFIAANRDLMQPLPMGYSPEFSRKMAGRGWVAMTWPKKWGGHERSALERYVVLEEMLAAGAPVGAHWVADRQSGPNIMRFGTSEQQEYFLPRIAAGELYFCIGMSEPNSGSDLAGTTTRATKVQGGYVVNGTKLWTSNAHRATYMILFCRVAPGASGLAGQDQAIDRKAGATQFLVDMKSPGIEVRPVYNMLGEHHFNEVFLTDLFVPDDRLLGQEGNGWKQVTSELAFERSGPERFLITFRLLVELVRLAGPDPEPPVAVAIGRLSAHLATLRRMSLSVAGMLERDENPNMEAALVKDVGTKFDQEVPEVARLLFPSEPELGALDAYVSVLSQSMMHAPRFSIQGGTREILRGIIARGLGLR